MERGLAQAAPTRTSCHPNSHTVSCPLKRARATLGKVWRPKDPSGGFFFVCFYFILCSLCLLFVGCLVPLFSFFAQNLCRCFPALFRAWFLFFVCLVFFPFVVFPAWCGGLSSLFYSTLSDFVIIFFLEDVEGRLVQVEWCMGFVFFAGSCANVSGFFPCVVVSVGMVLFFVSRIKFFVSFSSSCSRSSLLSFWFTGSPFFCVPQVFADLFRFLWRFFVGLRLCGVFCSRRPLLVLFSWPLSLAASAVIL